MITLRLFRLISKKYEMINGCKRIRTFSKIVLLQLLDIHAVNGS